MKLKYSLIICFFFVSFIGVNAQKLTQKQLEREKNKVYIFNSKERDNLHMWFYERVNEMKLAEPKREEYYSVILYYFTKIGRLDDKDKGYTKEEQDVKMDELVKRQNEEIKLILPKDKYKMHLDTYGELLRSVNNKRNKKN